MCILSYKYLLQGCVLFTYICSNPFFPLSARIGQSHSLPRSLAMRPRHALFVSLCPSLFVLFRVDVYIRRTLPLPLNHFRFTFPVSALF